MEENELLDEELHKKDIDDKDTIIDIDSDLTAPHHEKRSMKEAFLHSLKSFFSIHDDVAEHEIIKERIRSGGKITGTNASLLVLAIIIACIGLRTNSVAVIIGAMLISPLMGTIQAIAYGFVSLDKKFMLGSLKGLIFQMVVALTVSSLFFLISPLQEPTTELLNRTNPSFLDFIIAFCGGTAGIIAQTREDKFSNVIPGVAIATALMPPLCTVGYSLAKGQWAMLGGAAYLFSINVFFIFATSVAILYILNVPKVRAINEAKWKKLRVWMLVSTLVVSSIAITLAVLLAIGLI